MGRRDKIAFGVTLLAVVVIPGVVNNILVNLGYSTLGSIVWVAGYGMGIVMIWFVWLRPLGIGAPESVEPDDQ